MTMFGLFTPLTGRVRKGVKQGVKTYLLLFCCCDPAACEKSMVKSPLACVRRIDWNYLQVLVS